MLNFKLFDWFHYKGIKAPWYLLTCSRRAKPTKSTSPSTVPHAHHSTLQPRPLHTIFDFWVSPSTSESNTSKNCHINEPLVLYNRWYFRTGYYLSAIVGDCLCSKILKAYLAKLTFWRPSFSINCNNIHKSNNISEKDCSTGLAKWIENILCAKTKAFISESFGLFETISMSDSKSVGVRWKNPFKISDHPILEI